MGWPPTTWPWLTMISSPAPADIYLGTVEDNEIGNIAVDPRTGDVYQVFVGCPPSPTAVATCSALNTAYMAVGVPSVVNGASTLTFTDYVIHQSASASAALATNFPPLPAATARTLSPTPS